MRHALALWQVACCTATLFELTVIYMVDEGTEMNMDEVVCFSRVDNFFRVLFYDFPYESHHIRGRWGGRRPTNEKNK